MDLDLEQIEDLLDDVRQTIAEGEDESFDQETVDRWFACYGVEMLGEIRALRADLAAARAEVERVTKERDESIKDWRRARMEGYGQRCAEEKARIEKAEAEVGKLRARIDQAGDGMNLVGLLDLYNDIGEEQRARAEKAEAEVERLHVQLAGCSVAASGTDLDLSSDAYGWSVAFSDVAGLYRRMEKAEAEVERLRAVLSEVRDECSRRVPRVTPRKT